MLQASNSSAAEVIPDTATWLPGTETVSSVTPSLDLLIVIWPMPGRTASLKTIDKLASQATPVASSAGERLTKAGGVKSPVVKFHAAPPLIPAESLPARS